MITCKFWEVGDRMPKKLHIVWSPQVGPIAAYTDPTKAYTHARTMLGVNVSACDLLEQLPPIARDDVVSDFEGDDDTPQVVDVDHADIDEP